MAGGDLIQRALEPGVGLTLSVSPEPSAVADRVEGARRAFLAGDGRRGMVVDLAADLPPVMADRRRVVQVLNNLLANAARQTTTSSVIRVTVVREAEYVAVSVADDVEGVAPDLLPHLFRRNVGGAGGTASQGLGLAICKGLVEAQGGASAPKTTVRARGRGSPSRSRPRRQGARGTSVPIRCRPWMKGCGRVSW